ncbi:MAG: CapA family protein [Candidatus Uhrbacteria bacterium]|nr:CapA family protein [Candidatus Uhrbacteria bacterium]
MRLQTFLLIFTATLGTGLLIAGIIIWPTYSFPNPVLPQSRLPQAENKAEPVPAPKLTLFFTGDIMLARGVEWRIGQEGINYPLENMVEIISAADIAIGNFEGTIREVQNVEPGYTMSFDTTPALAQMVIDSGFDVLSLANNHGDDFGPSVTTYTRDTIEALGAFPVGDPSDSANNIARIDRNGFALSIIGYHAFGEEYSTIVEAIALEKAAGRFVIVFPHWGPEYESTPHASAEVEPAHAFVDAGADLVIGAHPHVIQTIETYNGVPVIYSLGNFLFDQDWSVPTQQGMTVLVTLTDNDITLDFATVQVSLQKTTPMSDEASAALLSTYDIPATMTIPRISNIK